MTDNKHIDLESLDVNYQSYVGGKADLSLLKEASRYGIELDELETTNISSNKAIMPEQDKPQQKREQFFWQELDVNLKDIVNLLMDSSERPIIIVSDDKLQYLNPVALGILELLSYKSVIDTPFLTYVDRSDWNSLTTNIGEMLTSAKKQKIRLRSSKGKLSNIEFQAIYLPDSKHFSFILVGEHQNKTSSNFNSLYDDLTGLPNFFLFEDRVQMAINNENHKDSRSHKNIIAVIGINIDNIETFRKLHLEDFIVKKMANTLVLSLNKAYTISKGLKYHFWIMMPNLSSFQELDRELLKLMAIFRDGVSDNFNNHELLVSVGVSTFPNPARSAKKIMEQSLEALKEAQTDTQKSSVVKFRL